KVTTVPGSTSSTGSISGPKPQTTWSRVTTSAFTAVTAASLLRPRSGASGACPFGEPSHPCLKPRRSVARQALDSRAGRRILAGVAVTPDEARAVALSMPEAIELDHHARPSFRVSGKIFATLWNEDRMNVMLDEGGILTAVERAPDSCEQVWWGKRL